MRQCSASRCSWSGTPVVWTTPRIFLFIISFLFENPISAKNFLCKVLAIVEEQIVLPSGPPLANIRNDHVKPNVIKIIHHNHHKARIGPPMAKTRRVQPADWVFAIVEIYLLMPPAPIRNKSRRHHEWPI